MLQTAAEFTGLLLGVLASLGEHQGETCLINNIYEKHHDSTYKRLT